MKNIEKYQSLLETGEVDALLLTSVYNRLYAAQYLSLIHILRAASRRACRC